MTTFVIGVVVSPAGATHSTTSGEQGVTPTYVVGNPKCAPGTEIRHVQGSPTGATPTANGVTISNATNTSFDWDSTVAIGMVIVKAADGGNVYTYGPNTFSDTGLQSPHTQSNTGTNVATISHISFCVGTTTEDEEGFLEVEKDVVNNVGDSFDGSSLSFTFNVSCTDGSSWSSQTVSETTSWTSPAAIAADANCTVTEVTSANPSAGSGAQWGSPSYSPSQTVAIVDNVTVSVLITNPRNPVTTCCVVIETPQLGSLTVRKVVLGGEGDESFDFGVDCGSIDRILTLGDGDSQTITDIPFGTSCTVTEQEPEDSETETWTTSVTDSDGAADGTVVIDGAESVTFTNSRTEVAPTVITSPPTTAAPQPQPEPTVLPAVITRELPRTGIATQDYLLLAGAAILLGGLLLTVSDRRKPVDALLG